MSTTIHSATIEDQITKLQTILNNLKDVVPNGNQKGEKYHSFGTSNLHSEQENVDHIISSMKTAYNNFTKISNPSNILKHVTERMALNAMSNPVSKCLQEVKNNLRLLTNDNTLKSTIQRLEALCLEEGLRFDKDNNIFISCDMFYIEIALDANGLAEDVKAHYTHTGGGDTSLKDLVDILRRKDFDEFHVHLKGLKERYLMLKGDTFKKSKILSSLDVLEKDIMKIMQTDISSNNITDMIMSGPVGYVTPTLGGRHLFMTYCANPLDLLDTRQPGMNKVFTGEDPPHHSFGHSVSLCIEQSSESLLPSNSMVTVDNNVLKYLKSDPSNSIRLPAQFVLLFKSPLPMSVHTARVLQKHLNPDSKFFHDSSASLDDLIIKQRSGMNRTEWKKKEFCTDLPGEAHLFRCLPTKENEIPGMLVSKIPFTQVAQLPKLIKILRCQTIYNMLLCSCITSNDEEDNDNDDKQLFVFDVKTSEENILTINFIHPLDETLGTLDLHVTFDGKIECSLNVLPGSPIICPNDYLDKIANKCLSIPLIMRCLMKKSKTCRPEQVATASTTNKLAQIPSHKALKLVMPTIAQMQSQHSLVSPQLTSSPSAFLNFSATGISPGTPMFHSGENAPGHKRKRTPSSNVSTPSSDGNKTPSKLKLTLKRKRTEASEIYEIDKSKSDIETATSESYAPITTAKLKSQESTDSLNFMYPQFPNDEPTIKRSNSVFSDGMTFSELGGIPLESDADLDNLLGIPSEPFIQSDSTSDSMGNVQSAAFDIDTIRGGNEMNFDSLPSNAIDPSSLVTTPTSFDIDASGMIDMDNLM